MSVFMEYDKLQKSSSVPVRYVWTWICDNYFGNGEENSFEAAKYPIYGMSFINKVVLVISDPDMV